MRTSAQEVSSDATTEIAQETVPGSTPQPSQNVLSGEFNNVQPNTVGYVLPTYLGPQRRIERRNRRVRPQIDAYTEHANDAAPDEQKDADMVPSDNDEHEDDLLLQDAQEEVDSASSVPKMEQSRNNQPPSGKGYKPRYAGSGGRDTIYGNYVGAPRSGGLDSTWFSSMRTQGDTPSTPYIKNDTLSSNVAALPSSVATHAPSSAPSIPSVYNNNAQDQISTAENSAVDEHTHAERSDAPAAVPSRSRLVTALTVIAQYTLLALTLSGMGWGAVKIVRLLLRR